MRPLPLALAILAAAVISMAGTTTARAGAWCTWETPWVYDCGFRTFQQCLDNARGLGGICRPNPRYAGPPEGEASPRKRRYTRH
jgi:hypothetical protein